MTPVILLRHARSAANGAGVLAGRLPGIGLDETGRAQAAGLVERLVGCRIGHIVSSPAQRCLETVQPLAAALEITVEVDEDLAEVDYGAWAGHALAELREDPLWATVQQHPSGMVFPGGEALAGAAARGVAAARRYAAQQAEGATLLCSHGDIIAAVIADALGMHLDLFQRLLISPASISVLYYMPGRPLVAQVNDTGGLTGIGIPADDAAGAAAAASDQAGIAESLGGDPGRGARCEHDGQHRHDDGPVA